MFSGKGEEQMKPQKPTRKKIAFVLSIIFAVLYFMVIVFTLVVAEKNGDMSSAFWPIIFILITAISSLVSICMSGKEDDTK